MARRNVFYAIADPTRREILNLIAYEAQNINAIAENFDISRQAVSLQIRILEECGLVEITKQGRQRHCKATLQPLNEVAEWVDQFRSFWDDKLSALEMHIQKMQSLDQPDTKKT